jgi:protein arginine phosphatase
MAEALLKKIAQEAGIEVEVKSAGVSAMEGSLAAEQASQVLMERGIEHSHRSQMLSPELVRWADLILTMTARHKFDIQYNYPESVDKIYTLKEYANQNTKVMELYQQLDRIYVEMENKRVEIRARYSLTPDKPWPKEAEEAWRKEIVPLRKREQELLILLEQKRDNVDVSDPFGGSVDVYRQCADELEREIRKIVAKWNRSSDAR